MQYIEKEGIKLQKEQFDITGMTCSACSARVEKSVSKLPGIQEVAVNLLKNSMVASYDETVLSADEIVKAVEKAGYGAFPQASGKSKKTEKMSEMTQQKLNIKNEKTFSYFIGVWRFTFLHFNGTYDGVAFAPNPYRNEKCNDFCFYSVFCYCFQLYM